MNYAFYEMAKCETEKAERLSRLREENRGKESFYSVYIDVPEKFNPTISTLRAWKSLMAAVRKGRIDIVVLSSLENLYTSERAAAYMLSCLTERGVQVAIGAPENVWDEKKLSTELCEKAIDFIRCTYSAPLITMENCYVSEKFDAAFVYLEKDYAKKVEKLWERQYQKMRLIDAVQKYDGKGFYIYRSDVDSWYHIADYMTQIMLDIFDIGYLTLFESLGLDGNPDE